MANSPPAYQEYSSPYQADNGQTNGVFIPDDFKYDTKVISCEPQVRMNFMSKVYSILSAQLLATFAFTFFVSGNEKVKNFIFTHMALFWLFSLVSIITCVWISVSPRPEDIESYANDQLLPNVDTQEESPRLPWYILTRSGRLILLSIFTFAEAYTVSVITVSYDPSVVLRALLITLVIVGGVSLMAVSGRFEMTLTSATSVYYWLNWALWLLIGIGISSIFFGMGSGMSLLYGWLGAIVFTVYLFIDTQLIFRKVYADEEIRCAMMLYLDIINLFLSILRIMSNRDDN